MKVFRFMSQEEFDKLQNGETLINTDNHKDLNTNSVGFCFMDCEDYSPESAYEFLDGIVSEDIVVQFEVDESLLTKSGGMYADPDGEWFLSRMWVDEYCCTSYNNKDFKLLSYAKPDWSGCFDWTEVA